MLHEWTMEGGFPKSALPVVGTRVDGSNSQNRRILSERELERGGSVDLEEQTSDYSPVTRRLRSERFFFGASGRRTEAM